MTITVSKYISTHQFITCLSVSLVVPTSSAAGKSCLLGDFYLSNFLPITDTGVEKKRKHKQLHKHLSKHSLLPFPFKPNTTVLTSFFSPWVTLSPPQFLPSRSEIRLSKDITCSFGGLMFCHAMGCCMGVRASDRHVALHGRLPHGSHLQPLVCTNWTLTHRCSKPYNLCQIHSSQVAKIRTPPPSQMMAVTQRDLVDQPAAENSKFCIFPPNDNKCLKGIS